MVPAVMASRSLVEPGRYFRHRDGGWPNLNGDNMRRTRFHALVLLAIASLAVPASAEDAVDVEKAKAEGKVVWYTSTPIEQAQKIADAFQKEYGIKVEMFRSGGRRSCAASSRRWTPGASPPTC